MKSTKQTFPNMVNNMIRHAWIMAIVCVAIYDPAFAIQKETTAEKAENLEKQVKGGLFNFWNFDTQAPETTPDGFAAITVGKGRARNGLWRQSRRRPPARIQYWVRPPVPSVFNC